MNKLLSLVNPLKKSSRPISLGIPGGEMNACSAALQGMKEYQRSECLNGMKIAAGKIHGSPLVACTVMFQAGSRNEVDDELGVTHFLRAASTTSGLGVTEFIKSRFMQQMGGYISVTTDRQTVSYTMRCPMVTFPELKFYLLDGGVRCSYPEHELDAVRKMVREDLAKRPLAQVAIDMVQKACFAGPIANSVYCDASRIDRINSDIINKYVSTFFKTNVCTIGSYGVSFDEVLKVGAYIDCGSVERPPDLCTIKSYPRGGFEFEDMGPGGDTYIALAVPGCGTCDVMNSITHAIVAAACGIGSVHGGSHTWDRNLQPPLSCLMDDAFTDYRAFNISYSDTGCWGILIKTRSAQARDAVFRANDFFCDLGPRICNFVQTGKNRLKLGVMLSEESCERASESLALQMACNIHLDGPAHMCQLIDSIPAQDVISVANCLAAKRLSGQMGVAIVGDVEACPNDVELYCY